MDNEYYKEFIMLSLALSAVSNLFDYVNDLDAVDNVNYYLEETPPFTIVVATIAGVLSLQKAYHAYRYFSTNSTDKIIGDALDSIITTAMKLPLIGPEVKYEVNKQITKALASKKKKHDEEDNTHFYYSLPDEPLSNEEILEQFNLPLSSIEKGRLSGAIYTEPTKQQIELINSVANSFGYQNPLHEQVWPDAKKMEAACLSMFKGMIGLADDMNGTFTYGGSFSIFEGIKGAAIKKRRELAEGEVPEVILPNTAHVAFIKSVEATGIKAILVPVDSHGKADVKAMEEKINKRTCAIVGSAGSFLYGMVDPINELADLAVKHDMLLFVDGCLGGLQVALAKKLKVPTGIPDVNFAHPGIGGFTFDPHKFGQTEKGVSVVFLKLNDFLSASATQTELTKEIGTYVTPTIGGSGTARLIAVTYATLLSIGMKGYIENLEKIFTLRNEFISRIQAIDGLTIPYGCELSVIGMKTDPDTNAHVLLEEMENRGWHLNVINGPNCKPEGLHFCLTHLHTGVENLLDDFINDLKSAVEHVKNHPNQKPAGSGKVYGTLSTSYIPPCVEKGIGKYYQAIINSKPGQKFPGLFEDFNPNEPTPLRKMYNALPSIKNTYKAVTSFSIFKSKSNTDTQVEVASRPKKIL